MAASTLNGNPEKQKSSLIVVYAALAGNIAVALTKLYAAKVTGSAAMFSEAVHSVVDCSNNGLVLLGHSRSAKQPDLIHPLGCGRELYFWTFIVALMLFGLGAGVSLVQGVRHVTNPVPAEDIKVSLIVLGLSLIFEGTSLFVAWRTIDRAKGEQSLWSVFLNTKDVPSFTVLFEDSAAVFGIGVAIVGIVAAHVLEMPIIDGIASILIGLILATVSITLAVQSKSLLIGESVAPELVEAVRLIAQAQAGVMSANSGLSAQMAPDQAAVGLSIEFENKLTADDIESCVAEIEQKVKQHHPEVIALFVKPQSNKQFEAARLSRLGTMAAQT